MNSTFQKVYSELERGMRLSKCIKCGCMKATLENLKASLPLLKIKDSKEMLKSVNKWLNQLQPLEYPCFGCKFCIPPEAMTLLTKKYHSLTSSTLSTCEIKVSSDSWPPVEGEYTIIDSSAPVAVSTLASTKLEEKIVKAKSEGLCIIGKTETENIGIDKIIKNVISNPVISQMIITGKDTEGHQSGKTLLALWKNGVDKNMKVTGSKGRRPILKNVTRTEIKKFREQIQMVDMIGSENTRSIAKKIRELALNSSPAECAPSCGCHDQPIVMPKPVVIGIKSAASNTTSHPSRITANKHGKNIKLDKAGYFVILPTKKNKTILVEHYSYENKLLREIKGKSSRDIYFTIINNKWVTELNHAAYIGKELARAELSIKKGFKFVQDGA